ncbi:MAG: hypothetical protein JRJ15_04045, partial [Deltaproteobacteria bacterium]|nr:hypothetical protein [Deltaproteobacteria bacterium]
EDLCSPECKKALKSENNKQWRRKNADCCQNDYPRVKEWLDQNPGYLKKYRQVHPEYVRKNREAQRVRDRSKKLRLDIQAQLNIKPLEMTFLFSACPVLIYKFSWIDHRLITGGFLLELPTVEILLCFFLVAVSDRNVISFYHDDRICGLLKFGHIKLFIVMSRWTA